MSRFSRDRPQRGHYEPLAGASEDQRGIRRPLAQLNTGRGAIVAAAVTGGHPLSESASGPRHPCQRGRRLGARITWIRHEPFLGPQLVDRPDNELVNTFITMKWK